jgi:hypothetical protein
MWMGSVFLRVYNTTQELWLADAAAYFMNVWPGAIARDLGDDQSW